MTRLLKVGECHALLHTFLLGESVGVIPFNNLPLFRFVKRLNVHEINGCVQPHHFFSKMIITYSILSVCMVKQGTGEGFLRSVVYVVNSRGGEPHTQYQHSPHTFANYFAKYLAP